jgi:hypothetical protein
MHLEQSPLMGTTLLERLKLEVASLELGVDKFMAYTPEKLFSKSFDRQNIGPFPHLSG